MFFILITVNGYLLLENGFYCPKNLKIFLRNTIILKNALKTLKNMFENYQKPMLSAMQLYI